VEKIVAAAEDDPVTGNVLHVVAVQHDNARALVQTKAETRFSVDQPTWPDDQS
jgi:hypothetical protein